MFQPLTEAEIGALSPTELDQYLGDMEAIAGGESFRDFISRMTPHHPAPRHLYPLIELIERARIQPGLKVCISMPPGHAKTTLFLNAIAWWLTKFPGDICAFNSFNETKALAESTKARALAERAGIELSEDTNSKAEWRTPEGGGLLAGGLESLTGRRVQGPLVVDDPYSGPLDAYSPAYREAAFEAIRTVAITRREGGAPFFLIHTRWHSDDAIGRFKQMQREGKISGWIFVNLPAIDESGSALWPDMHPIEELLEVKAIEGEYNFAALYQGDPRPRGNALFGDPHYYDPTTTSFEGCRLVISADPAASVKTSADYSAAVVLAIRGFEAEAVGYVRHAYRRQVTIPQFAEDLLVLQMQWGMAPIYVESVGAFKAVPQILRQLKPDIRVVEVVPQGDKFQRAQRVAAAWNQGRVLVPATEGRAPPAWLGPFLDELAVFTGVNDAHDDAIDCLSQGWNAGPAVTMFDAVR